jgi:UDP-galactopyranose mutase
MAKRGRLISMKYDYVIIGAGLSAAVSARMLADAGYKILIVERRNHLGGNLFDEKNEDGILVQKYGPHTFHTNNDKVIDFVTKYADFEEYHLKCEVNIDGVITPSPFNFKTIDQFYDVDKAKILKEKLKATYPLGKATVLELLDSKDKDIKEYAVFLFEKDYSLYTSKQWGISPSEVDPSVLKRVPIEFSYKDWYFYDKFEGIPNGGFMQFMNNMFNSNNIETKTGINGLEHISFKNNKVLYDNEEVNVIFTGETDELFNYKFGKLPYRSLRFEYEKHNKKEYQTSAIVAYPSHDYGYTRITEYTKMPFQNFDNTIIAKEYPLSYDSNSNNEPYYPILTKDSQEKIKCYMDEASKYSNLTLLGRLAQFKYFNMDQCVLNAIETMERILSK